MTGKLKVDLSGAPQTMLATFYAKALDAELEKPILGDRWAKDIVNGDGLFLPASFRLVLLFARRSKALVARGVLTREEAEHHPGRHTLREAIMGDPLTLIDRGTRRLPADARLLLCSDGVQTLVDDDL